MLLMQNLMPESLLGKIVLNRLGLSYKYNDLPDKYQQGKDINERLMKKTKPDNILSIKVEEAVSFSSQIYFSFVETLAFTHSPGGFMNFRSC